MRRCWGRSRRWFKDKRSLLVAPAGAPDRIAVHLLVTEKPKAAIPEKFDGYREAAWLLRRQAVSVLPSVASLSRCGCCAPGSRHKTDDRFWRSVVRPAQDGAATNARRQIRRDQVRVPRPGERSLYEFWRGGRCRPRQARGRLRNADTADELNAVAKDLGVSATDIHRGSDASETTVKRAPLADYAIVYFADPRLVAGDVKRPRRTVAGAEHSKNSHPNSTTVF